ncbi:MAG: hypothetical protein WCY89_07115 [Flavobacteriaceae bacterium]
MIKNRKIQILGIIFIVIGTLSITLSPFTLYFYYLPLIIFIIGILILWFSKRKIKSKIILTILPFLFYGIFTFLWVKFNTVAPETFLIPENYRGRVNIIYKENCGQFLEKTKEGFIYYIPEDGILLLSNEQKYGFITHEYYMVDENGNKTILPKMDVRDFNEEWTLEKNPNEPPRDKLGVFHWGRTGSIGKMIDANGNETNKDEQYTFKEFYISTYNDLEDKFNFKYEREFDSIRDSKLEKCK